MDNARVLYIDAFNYFYAQLQVNKAMDENGEPIGGFIGLVDQIQRLVYRFNPHRVVVIFDGPDAGMRRRSLFPDYKGRKARKKHLSKVDIGDTPIEIDNEEQQLKLAYAFLRLLPVTISIIPFYEADDIITHLALKNINQESIICSSDKDYLQIVQDNISVWAWGKKTLFTPVEVVEQFKVMPENFAYFRCIVGDSSDKLPGIEGIGETTILKLVPKLTTEAFVDFEAFWQYVMNLDSQLITETKIRNSLTSLKEQKDQAWLMYRLMKLGADQLKLKAVEQLRVQLAEQQVPRFDSMKLKIHCIKNHLEPHFKYFDSWTRPFVTIKKTITLNA